MAQTAALPVLSGETGLTRYLEEIRRFPMLEPQEEFMLAKRWREHGDRDAAHRLVTSHLRLVAKIAMGYRGYGLPISEVISEGNVGLMQAVKRAFRAKHDVRHAINELYKLLPPDLASTEQAKQLYEHGCVTEMDIVQLVYRPAEPQGASKDYEFSRSSMQRLWQQGTSERLLKLWSDVTTEKQPPNLCLIDFYNDEDKLGLHQDRGESSLEAPAGGGGRPNLASVLQEGDKSANIHVRSGAIWGIPVTRVSQHRVQGLPASSLVRSALARCQPYQPRTS